MRYRHFKTITSKIFDGQIVSEDDIKVLLKALNDKELTCRIQLKNENMLDNVRISDIGEQFFTWKCSRNQSVLTRTSQYLDIEVLEVNTESENLLQLKPAPSRWTLVDVGND